MEKQLHVTVRRSGAIGCSTDAERLKEPEPDQKNDFKIEFEGILIEIISLVDYSRGYLVCIVMKKDGSLVQCKTNEIIVWDVHNPLISKAD